MLKSLGTAIVLVTLSPVAVANVASEAVIADAVDQVSSGSDIGKLIDDIDVEAIAYFVLGRHAEALSQSERLAFIDAFRRFLTDTMAREAGRFANVKVEVLGSRDRNERDSVVRTRMTSQAGDVALVSWRLMKRTEDWRVVDVQVEGLWMAIELRAQVNAILGNSGVTIEDAIRALE